MYNHHIVFNRLWRLAVLALLAAMWAVRSLPLEAADPLQQDLIRQLQEQAADAGKADWGHWGADPDKYSSWTSHSNRLVPIYTFGIGLDSFRGKNSVYRDSRRLARLYGDVPRGTYNPRAEYFDQTDVYRLQRQAVEQNKRYVILIIFDGMDWQTTQAAAIYRSGKVYTEGRGSGLYFQDYRGAQTDFGFFVTSPHNAGTNADVDAQTVLNPSGTQRGGYNAVLGGATPWATPHNLEYLTGKLRTLPHVVTDSASSATSMTSGIKTFNGAINVDPQGDEVEPIARWLQAKRSMAVGVVTSVEVSHATPAAAYANNVSRGDYQDLSRDLLGLPSVFHRNNSLPGVDVLLGCGWGETSDTSSGQGQNYVPGHTFVADSDLERIDASRGGKYRVVQRTAGQMGGQLVRQVANQAAENGQRLFGFFGVTPREGGDKGHLPYRTADGRCDPVGIRYDQADIDENPTLADMTEAALTVLETNRHGFWLMIESGDVDWANHANNIDNAIGAVLAGDDAFRAVVEWIERHNAWDQSLVIVTADHGHLFVPTQPEVFARQKR